MHQKLFLLAIWKNVSKFGSNQRKILHAFNKLIKYLWTFLAHTFEKLFSVIPVCQTYKALLPMKTTLKSKWKSPALSFDTFVAVDCIALNFRGKHKQEMAIRGIN